MKQPNKENSNNKDKKERKRPTQTKTKALSKNTGVASGLDLVENHKHILEEYFNNGYNKSKAVTSIMPSVKSQSAAVHVFNAIASKPIAKKYINSIQARLRANVHISKEQSLTEFTSWSFTDATDFIGLSIEDIRELPANVRRSIQSYKETERTETDRSGNAVKVKTIDLKLVNKLDALKEATKIIGGYEIDNSQKNKTLDISALDSADQLALLKILTKGTNKQDDNNTIDVS